MAILHALISPVYPWAGTAPGSWHAFIPIVGPRSLLPQEECSGATNRTAGRKPQLFPLSTLTPWAARPSGSSTAVSTPQWCRDKASSCTTPSNPPEGTFAFGFTRGSSTIAGPRSEERRVGEEG